MLGPRIERRQTLRDWKETLHRTQMRTSRSQAVFISFCPRLVRAILDACESWTCSGHALNRVYSNSIKTTGHSTAPTRQEIRHFFLKTNIRRKKCRFKILSIGHIPNRTGAQVAFGGNTGADFLHQATSIPSLNLVVQAIWDHFYFAVMCLGEMNPSVIFRV
jgi:hypothetical protein